MIMAFGLKNFKCVYLFFENQKLRGKEYENRKKEKKKNYSFLDDCIPLD